MHLEIKHARLHTTGFGSGMFSGIQLLAIPVPWLFKGVCIIVVLLHKKMVHLVTYNEFPSGVAVFHLLWLWCCSALEQIAFNFVLPFMTACSLVTVKHCF